MVRYILRLNHRHEPSIERQDLNDKGPSASPGPPSMVCQPLVGATNPGTWDSPVPQSQFLVNPDDDPSCRSVAANDDPFYRRILHDYTTPVHK